MADVFVSYARSTAKQAREIARALQMAGYSVWIDDELPSHRDYADVIAEQIGAARAVLVVWSADAVASQWVRSEAGRARANHKLVQLSVERAPLPMPFDQIHCADLSEWQGDAEAPAWRKVLGSVEALTRSTDPRPSAVSSDPMPRLAVLPFENFSGDPEMQALSDGVSADIIHALGRDEALSVIGRAVSFQFRGERKQEAAQALGATHVLDGTVRRAGSRVRIGAELTAGASGAVVWSERYDREADDLFDLQDEIVGKVAAALRRSLAGGPADAPSPAEPVESELRQVSVLAVEVDGLAELAAALEAGEVAELRRRLFALLADGVEAFDGFVERTTAGGLVGLFGAPVAYEDHAQRACLAALRLAADVGRLAETLRTDHGVAVSARMGVSSGEVIVGQVGDGRRSDYAAQGHAVTTALRLHALAEPGAIYVGGATAALAQGYLTLRDLGPQGDAAGTHAFRLEGVGPSRTRLDVARTRGLSTFVGRAADLQTLDDALRKCLAGEGRVIGVMAEAGAGKSRLCFEFLEHCRANGMQVHESRALAHGRKIPFLPILDLLRAYLQVGPDDDAPTARAKIEARMLQLDPAFAEALPLVFDFLGVPAPARPGPLLTPDARRQQLIGVVRQLIRRLSEAQPIVTMIEDLHWMDPASAEFLEQVIDPQGGAHTLLLLNFRPEFHAEWMGKSWYRQIPLEPLAATAISELLLDLLGDNASVRPLTEVIHARTGGNPFFVEELVQDLVETGQLEGARGARRLVVAVAAVKVPDTVQAVLATRIDRLSAEQKRLLQTAAVIGKDFPEALLANVAGVDPQALTSRLGDLQAAEFIHEIEVWPARVYSFRHPLTQEVALNSQLRERRRKTHVAVAKAIEALNADRLDEMAALLATHWSEAGQSHAATQWWLRSARYTLARSEPGEALVQVGHALVESAKLPQDERRWTTEVDLHVLAGTALLSIEGHGGAATGAAFDRALQICAKLPTSPQRLTVEFSVWMQMLHRLQLDDGLALCERMLARAVEESSAEWRFAGLRARAQLHFHAGRFSEAATDFEAVLDDWYAGRTTGLPGWVHDPAVTSVHTFYSYTLTFMGRLDEARREMAATLALDEHSRPPLLWAQSLFTEAVYFDLIGQNGPGTALMQSTLDYAVKNGIAYFDAICSAYLGHSLARAGAPERGLPLVSGAVQSLKARGSLLYVPGFLGRQGDVLTTAGSAEEALPCFDDALELIDRSGSRREEALVRSWRARALAGLDRREAAEAEFGRALEIARTQASPLLQAYVLDAFAPFLAQAGRAGEARQWLAECQAGFSGDPDAPVVLRIRTLMDQAGASAVEGLCEKEIGHA